MNYYQYHINTIAMKMEAEMHDRAIYDYIIELIKKDKFSQTAKYKELWFLSEASFNRGREWILKACKTLEYHKITPPIGETILDFLLEGKRQMKEDRKNGLKLW